MSAILAIMLASVGIATGVFASSRKRMRTHEDEPDWVLWSGYLGMLTVGLVLGLFKFPAEAMALPFSSLGALLASKVGQTVDPRIRRWLVNESSGVIRAFFLGETSKEKKERRKRMRLARRRERKIRRI